MVESHGDRGETPPTAGQLKEAFIALISDDLLTPLAAVMAGAELIQKIVDLGPQALVIRQCVTRILDSTTRLTSMVDDLLDISRIEDGSFPVVARPISLEDFLPDILTHLAVPLEGRGLELAFEKGLPLAWADPDLLARVVKNLLVAAVKHSPVGSPILVRAVAAGAEVLVSVTDHGAGIAAEQLPRALAKLRRPPAGGLGLCLYITKRAVEALGGQMHVQSEVGLGCTFGFTLPCIPDMPSKGTAS